MSLSGFLASVFACLFKSEGKRETQATDNGKDSSDWIDKTSL